MNDKNAGGWRIGSDDETPVDVAALHADDEFIDSISRGIPVYTRDNTEYELAELLSGWRYETLAAGTPALPPIDEVEASIAAEREAAQREGAAPSAGRGRRAMRHLRVLSGAAAVVVVAAAGLVVVSENAQPGDALWGVKQVVFSEQASQTQAMVDVRSNLELAEAAVAAGDTAAAVGYLQKAERDLQPVRDDETRRRLDEWIARLRTDADQQASSGAATSSAARSADAAVPQPGGPTTATAPANEPTTPATTTAPSVTVTTPQPSTDPTTPSTSATSDAPESSQASAPASSPS